MMTERLIFGCKVRFGAGALVQQIMTPFDSHHIVVSNLTSAVTQEEFLNLTAPFGNLISIILENSADATGPVSA